MAFATAQDPTMDGIEADEMAAAAAHAGIPVEPKSPASQVTPPGFDIAQLLLRKDEGEDGCNADRAEQGEHREHQAQIRLLRRRPAGAAARADPNYVPAGVLHDPSEGNSGGTANCDAGAVEPRLRSMVGAPRSLEAGGRRMAETALVPDTPACLERRGAGAELVPAGLDYNTPALVPAGVSNELAMGYDSAGSAVPGVASERPRFAAPAWLEQLSVRLGVASGRPKLVEPAVLEQQLV